MLSKSNVIMKVVVKLASKLVFHNRNKHIEVRHHYIIEKVLEQEIELKGILIVDQVANILTKALIKPKFEISELHLEFLLESMH